MKEKYIKYKKNIRSFLGLGATVAVIGLFSLFTKLLVLGIILIVVGIGLLVLSAYFKKETVAIEKYSKEKCPICGDDVVYSTETRYYVGNNLSDEEEFNKETITYDKLKKVIHYYKCEKCNFCLTVIESYSYVYGKEKRLNDFVNMDFNYTGAY